MCDPIKHCVDQGALSVFPTLPIISRIKVTLHCLPLFITYIAWIFHLLPLFLGMLLYCIVSVKMGSKISEYSNGVYGQIRIRWVQKEILIRLLRRSPWRQYVTAHTHDLGMRLGPRSRFPPSLRRARPQAQRAGGRPKGVLARKSPEPAKKGEAINVT